MILRQAKLYPITDVRLSGMSHAQQVKRLSEGGATLVQLREKNLAAGEFYKQAEEALLVARRRAVAVIINDRVDIALALKADGVHLGQDDLPVEAARRLLGDKAIIGISTHNLEQVRLAANLPVDYLALGPIFATSSKQSRDPLVGLEMIRQVRKLAGPLPLVAIGGITERNAAAVRAAGADTVAVISDILGRPSEIATRTRSLLSCL